MLNKIINLGENFRTFWSEAKDCPYGVQEKLWNKYIESDEQDFYDDIVFQKDDREDCREYSEKNRKKRLKLFFEKVPEIYTPMMQEFESFDHIIISQLEKFKNHFPDANFSDVSAYAVPSVMSFNGKGEILNDKPVLAFGMDMIAYFVKNPKCLEGFHAVHDADILYSHEMFHVYHNKFLSITKEKIKKEGKLSHLLWMEGLAVFASGVLNPNASIEAMLMDANLPKIAKPKIKSLSEKFLKVAGEKLHNLENPQISGAWFDMSTLDNDILIRGGYYLGFEVVSNIANKYQLEELVRWDFDRIHTEVKAELEKMIQ